ncbi:MAG: beta-galactosidase [Candidatus Fervidibacter sp.]|uniref:beta-galactosidase n=2 Tax=Candidatus Fervidibacter sp. TaxID=3100871 RepID=UPI00404916AB
MKTVKAMIAVALLTSLGLTRPLDRPIVGAVFFYWYEWDDDAKWGNWLGGVHNTPLFGYYDSRKFFDNFSSLLLAADWGVTHFFLDYWGYDWRGENNEPREMTVLKAAEKVRALGYPIFIGYYQDGTNFAMSEFWRNVSERRDTYLWLRDYARSPAWTWLFGKPFQMVYARNGAPELIFDHEGFRSWLQQRYGSIDKLNDEWGTHFRDFTDITMDFNSVGFQRAMSIAYQFERWQQDWAKLEQIIRQELGLPGLRASFDVGYAPFRGFGFERFARTFGGPHSYGGIFGQPHEQDAQRFLQAAVAKKCGTVFFDHLKHQYFDWNIRVPGGAYPPGPHHFERFWVGNLVRFVDGVLHLSWNEWWEGSNLEPSMEGGKRFCETNLLFSTLWQLTYQDREQAMGDAVIGLLVNDWIFEYGGGDANDLYNSVQGLRAVNAPFDIVLQSEANLDNLKRFRVLVAPAGGVGFGFNGKGERIGQVIREWVTLGERALITSQGGMESIGYDAPSQKVTPSVTPSSASRPMSPSFNFFVDIGAADDEGVLVQGFSHREDWGKLPEGAFGAGSTATVRWIPAIGNTTVLLLPAQPKADLLLRWHGSAIWQNRVTAFVNDQNIGEVAIKPGWHVYELRAPAEAIGKAKVIEVRLQFAEANVPGKKEPQRFPSEQRVCNLALDWVQLSTADVAPGERRGVSWQRMQTAQFVKPLSGSFRAPLHRRRTRLPGGRTLSTYADDIPRDLIIPIPSPHRPITSSLLFVNGIFTDDPRWWARVLEQVAKVPCGKFAQLSDRDLTDHPDLMSAVLKAGTTKFLLVENRSGKPCKGRLRVPVDNELPVAEITALSRDGDRFVVLPVVPPTRHFVNFVDTVHYYAAYQIVFSPVRITMPHWTTFPGQQTQLPVTVQNLTDNPVTVTLQVGAVIASINGKPVTVKLKPKERRQVTLPVEVKPFADWGVKTIFVKATWARADKGTEGRRTEGGTAFFLRQLVVGRNADVRCLTKAVTSHTPTITLVNAPTTPYGDLTWWHPAKDVLGETAKDVEVLVNGLADGQIAVKVGDLRDGEKKSASLPLPFSSSPVSRPISLVIRWHDSAGTHERKVHLVATLLPAKLPKTCPEQVATIIVPEDVQGLPMSVDLPKAVQGDAFGVRLPDGTHIPAYLETVNGKSSLSSVKIHFVIPPPPPLLRVDIGGEGDEKVLRKGFSFREVWANGATIRWLPGEGRETVLRLPRPKVESAAYLLRLHGQAFWSNRASVFANEQKLAELDIHPGLQTLTVQLPKDLWRDAEMAEVSLVFHQESVPAEKSKGSTDRRVCNFALDWLDLVPTAKGRPLLLALCRLDLSRPMTLFPSSIAIEEREGVVRVDNGVLELEWNEGAGGTLTKLHSRATGRDYAARSFGAGIGVFGRFDPNRPATSTAEFVLDDFVWQRNGKAKVRVTERNSVWTTVETVVSVKGFKAVQRYRIFTGIPLTELTVSVEPQSIVSGLDELIALEARFNTEWWTKSFPNFVGLGDKPPEVYGQHIVHFGWRMGGWVPPVLSLFNPNDLTETLSLLIAENDGANLVRQGFWGEQRGKPATKRKFTTMEIAAAPPSPVNLRLWIWLHEGHHLQALQMRQRLLNRSDWVTAVVTE